MKPFLLLLSSALLFLGCQEQQLKKQSPQSNIVNSDVLNFWDAYDLIHTTEDTALQYKYLDSFYLSKASPGLEALRQVRNYTREEYLKVITTLPKFWTSIRGNTMRSGRLGTKLQAGIDRLREIYPELKPATIYFAIGAFRTGGTTLDDMVLIGAEMAMGSENVVTSEFPEDVRSFRREFYDTNPIADLVLLNVHEFVHTQQNPPINNLLSQVVSEGVAEFVSVTAMGVPSFTPAINYGKGNDEVRKTFEKEMYNIHNQSDWLYSNAPNDFNVRDLGYYIGYSICELYYNGQEDKKAAIKKMIELNYEDEEEIGAFVDGTKFFSKPLDELYEDFESRRPQCVQIEPPINDAKKVSTSTKKITATFSEAMDTRHRNFDFGPSGEDALLRIEKILGWSEDGRSISFEVQDLEPNKLYELTLSVGFRNLDGVPLKPKLIRFQT